MSFLPTAAGKLPGFIFGAGTDVPTYDALRKRREIADTLAQQALGGTPRNVGEGITSVGRALAYRFMDGRLKPQEKAETDRAGSRLMEIAGLMTGRGGSPVMSSMGGAPEAPGATPTAPPGFTLPPQGDREQQIRDGLLRRGLPEHVADGFMLNFRDESRFDPGINEAAPVVPGSRGGFGLAQWTGPRRVALERFAQETGRPVGDVETQLDFLMTELQGSEAGAMPAIMGSRDAGGAAAAIASEFLRPAPEHLARRVADYTGGAGYQPGGLGSGGVSFDPALIAELGQLAGNPYLNDGQKLVAQALLQRAMGSSDAMTPYQQAQLALDQDRLAFDREKFAQGTREGPKYYGNTQWATDPETGAWRPYQIGTDGSVNWLDLGGAQPMPPTRSADLGTEIVPVGPGGVPTGTTLEKDNRGAEREKGIGKAQGEAIGAAATGLSNATAKAQQAVDLIDSIAGDPSLAGITGMVQGRLPPLTQAGTDLNAKIDQLRGKVFLEAFESLKGGGAITEIEGQKAEQAIARLQRAQSHEEFVAALTELRGVIAGGVERMRAKAAPAAPAGAAPTDMPQSAIDAGIDPALWQYLDENQRALWSN